MALAVAPDTQILAPREILSRADKRMRRFRERDALYDTLHLYYFGRTHSAESGGVLAMNSQGRPLLRDLEGLKGAGAIYSSQRLAPIVDDYQALVGRMPNSRVEPPDGSPQGQEKSELITKYLISTHEISDMDRQQALAGFYQAAYGDACYVFEADPDLRRVVWSVVDPRCAYPEFYRGPRRYQVYDLIVRTIEDPDILKRDYGYTPDSNSRDDCAMTVYLSPYQRTVVLGTDRIELGPDIRWDLGFCPAQWVYNKVNDNFGQSDIFQSLGQQDFLDFAQNIMIDGLIRTTYGRIIAIKNPNNSGENQILLGPNAPPVILQDDGAISAIDIAGDFSPAMKMIDMAIGDINAGSGTSQIRQEGQMHGSIQTGRAIHAAQGPQSSRVDLKQQNLGAALQQANTMTIQMQIKAPYLGRRAFSIWGRFKGKPFNEKITAEDLKWEGEAWTRNVVTWDSLMGLNLQQKEQIATQGMLGGIWDKIHARELVGMDDPIGMEDRVHQMKIKDAQTEAEVQKILGAGPGGAPSPGGAGGAPGGAGAAPQQGPPPPPQPIMRPPGMGSPQPQALPTGVPVGIARKAVEAALAPVRDKLKGGVFAVGDLALTGQSVKPHLLIEDHRDYTEVLQTIKALAPTVTVKALGGKELPPGAVRVA